MLVLRRKDGQWIEIEHRTGEVLRIRVQHIRGTRVGVADYAFDDPQRNFIIRRPEASPTPNTQ